MQCFIYLCNDLFVFARRFNILFSLYKYFIFVVFSSLIYVVSTQIYVVSTQISVAFVSGSTFSMTPDSQKLSSPAVACDPTYPTDSEITRHNNEQWRAYYFSRILHDVTFGLCGAVIKCLHMTVNL